MSNILNVAMASLDISAGDISANMQRLRVVLSDMRQDVDIVVLPELFSTGFISNRDIMMTWAESNAGRAMAELHELSGKYNLAFVGSFLANTGQQLYNRAFFIEPSGDEIFYDKRHMFSMSSESKILTPGNSDKLSIVRFRGWNIALTVCYDLRFPVWCRNSDLKYDIMLVPANWPSSREYAWRHLLIARAIENQAFVVGVDRSGEDKFGNYDGMSMAFDFVGKPIIGQRSGRALDYVAMDYNSLVRWRDDFTAWADADKFKLEN